MANRSKFSRYHIFLAATRKQMKMIQVSEEDRLNHQCFNDPECHDVCGPIESKVLFPFKFLGEVSFTLGLHYDLETRVQPGGKRALHNNPGEKKTN